MSSIAIIFPIFALVLAGWIARRTGVLGDRATVELNRFVVYLALPALLFDIVANAHWAQLWRPGFMAAFGLSMGVVFILVVGLRVRRRGLADAALDGLAASYGNVAFMGFPVMAGAFGPAGLTAAMIGTLMTVFVFAGAIVLIETGLQTERRPHRLALKVARALMINPMVIAPLAGAAAVLCGLAIPAPMEQALKMLGGTASPCALVTIGLFLGAPGRGAVAKGDIGAVAMITAAKLFLQPAIAFAAAKLMGLAPLTLHAVVLLAAMPTGTGPFMLAEFYQREARVTSQAILISTLLSVAALAVLLAVLR